MKVGKGLAGYHPIAFLKELGQLLYVTVIPHGLLKIKIFEPNKNTFDCSRIKKSIIFMSIKGQILR